MNRQKLNKSMFSNNYEGEEHKLDWSEHIFSGSNNNKYILIKRIGYGSYSSVWVAYKLNDNSNHFYAIKIHNTEDIKEGLKEIQIYTKFKKLCIPNIIKCVDQFVITKTIKKGESKHICIVLDLLACSLYDLLKSDKYAKGLHIDSVINITKQILESLNILHNNDIIHTDIKPENILLNGITFENKKILDDIKKKNGIKSIKKYIEKNIELFTDSDDDYSSSEMSYSDSDISDCSEKQFEDQISLLNFDSENSELIYSSNDEYIDNSKTPILLDTKYIENPNIVLTDLGTCLSKDERKRKSIQTKYYKAPEVLLKIGYDTKADIWALGCTIYELLTGEILFDPDNVKDQLTRYHLKSIIEIVGPIPEYMINNSFLKEVYFTTDYKLKGTVFYKNNTQKILNISSDPKYKKFLSCIFEMLEIDPIKRPSSLDLYKKLESLF